MSPRNLLVLVVALFAGLVAATLTHRLLARGGEAPAAGPQQRTTPVVVASIGLERGAVLKTPMLKLAAYPADAVPAGAFQRVSDLASGDRQRILARTIVANEPILAGALADSAAGGLAAALRPGMRAVAVRSDEVHGVGGFVRPGDRVDVLVTRSEGAGPVARPVAENALVLAVDQNSNPEAGKPAAPKSVTLEATPQAAQALSGAQSAGAVTLVLRSLADGARPAEAAQAPAPTTARRAARPVRPAPGGVTVTRGVETARYELAGQP